MKMINYLMWSLFLSVVLISIMPAEAITYPSNGIIHWKGQDWYLDSGKSAHGIGYWDDTGKGVWVDDQNRLHLTIKKDEGKWKCTQLYSENTYLYGTFTWTVDSPIFTFDKNSVMGLYTYADINQELDIETTKNAVFYIVQTPIEEENGKKRSISPLISGRNTKHRIEWKPNYVRFTSWKADGTVIADYTYSNVSRVPKQPEKVWMDLWLWNSPSDGQNIELIISDFTATNTK